MGRDFENRKHAMAKRGARDAKAFTKAGRQISMAVKAGGADPDANPALRRAIQNARAVNMPKDKIQYAIDKAAGATQSDDFQEVIYEGYGPHGVAVMVYAATDNPTRTIANIRLHFKKGGGTVGNQGSVAFMFDQFGAFVVRPEGLERDELELQLIDHGLERLEDDQGDDGTPVWVILCARESFGAMQNALEQRGIAVVSSGFRSIAKSTTQLSQSQLDDLAGLLERLEDDDDVQATFCNADATPL